MTDQLDEQEKRFRIEEEFTDADTSQQASHGHGGYPAKARLMRGNPKGTTPHERLSRRFNDEISSRTSATDLLRMYEKHRTEFCVVHAVTALHRIAKSPDGVDV
eukprot:gnl/MRDRNA2_/MRDRNA2_143619_c0_seq1.p1 gnl/MRDRNA2_/MRDRNA2_143619_c0~~gnl/MRDRNA2_/MRDRNA2_143619_c0_seq1.p1  ORF type:complete len:120 (-),score=21.40 gnl/MRDRNA2_/MRDRNA2_143619_c0_seq1:225-536(-)